MSIKDSATLAKIVTVLTSMETHGLQFKIVVDGAEFGNLVIPTQATTKRRVSKNRRFGSVAASFKDTLKKVSPGDLVLLNTPALPDLTTTQYTSCIAAWCNTHWGKGKYMTSRRGNGVEVLRVA